MLRHHLLPLSLAAALATVVVLPVRAEAVIDKPAPAFTAATADGKTLDLASLRGKTVVLEWTNHDCPFVRKHYESGNIPRLQKEATAKGVVWLQVISSAPGQQGHVDGPAAIKLNAGRGAAPTHILLDPSGKVGKLYGAQVTPHMYVIGPDGVVIYKGGIDSIPSSRVEDIPKATHYVQEALAELAAGKKITNPSTRPYGCSIKYAS